MFNIYSNYTVESERRGKRRWFDGRTEQQYPPVVDIREFKIKGNEVFVLGDQDGFPAEKRKLLKLIDKISVGPKVLFASQVLTIIHNEFDRKL